MKQGFPIACAGMTIGLLGGSFDPAHEGHAHITREAFKHFGLSRIWWLVSPGNPLKARGPAPMADRLAQARRVMQDPRVEITDLEAHLGTRYTAETLARLGALYPGVRFVWLMGADNLAQFHLWDNWRDIFAQVPVGVLARPGQRLRARCSKAAQVMADARLPAERAAALARHSVPTWCFVNVPLMDLSSSQIRAEGRWRRGG